jgi:DNA-binding NarL/FixJ family response regulator
MNTLVSLLNGDSDAALADGHAAARGESDPAPTPTTTVVIVDPHPPVRDGLSLLLPPQGIAVLGGAATGAGGEALVARHEPDVVLVAAELPDVEGLALLRRLVRRGLRSAVVLYADEDGDRERAAVAVHAGAAGLIAKCRSIQELATALRTIAGGGVWFEDREEGDAPTPMPARPLPLPRAQRRTSVLSSSELRVLALVADGSSTEATAETLSISPHTVRTHMRNVMRKLEASSRAHAVAIAIRESAIEL